MRLSSTVGGASSELKAVWLDLVVQLKHVLDELARPDIELLLRAVAERRRIATISRYLTQEYGQAIRIAGLRGIFIDPQEVASRCVELPLLEDLNYDFQRLAALYRQLLAILAAEGRTPTLEWAEGRYRVHAAQATELDRAINPHDSAQSHLKPSRGPP